MKYIYILFFLLLTLTACEKDSTVDLSYPSTYRCVWYENVSKIRLFTKSGEITDVKVINHFVERFGKDRSGDTYLYTSGISIPVEQLSFTPLDSIQLVNSSLARFETATRYKEYTLKRTGNNIEFTSIDTVYFYIPHIDERYAEINIGIHKPYYIEEMKFSSVGSFPYRTIYKGFLQKYATATPNQLIFPFINYVVAHSIKGYKLDDNTPVYTTQAQLSMNINDKLDPSAYKQLKEKDTLAVQEFRLIYEK